MSKHTPGRWYAVTAETGGMIDQAMVYSNHLTDGEPTLIADTMPVDDEVPLEQRKANAVLIAAALEMLAALKIALADLTLNDSAAGAVEDAIEKAEWLSSGERGRD